MLIPQSSYVGHHAELYDLFYADKPYEDEASFIHLCIQAYGNGGKKVLELACGTGNHAILLEKCGYEITATDYSVDMLNQAKKKAAISKSKVQFNIQDMRELSHPDSPYDVAICLFDSIGYVVTNENILKVLQGVRRQLKSDGLFIFEFWNAGAMLKGYDPVRVRRWQMPDREIIRISETSVDHTSQTCTVSYSVLEMMTNGQYVKLNESQINRFFLIQEMAQFLKNSDFVPLKWFAGFTDIEQIDSSVWHILCVALISNEVSTK